MIAPPPSLAAAHKNDVGGVYDPVGVEEFLVMPRTDEEGACEFLLAFDFSDRFPTLMRLLCDCCATDVRLMCD